MSEVEERHYLRNGGETLPDAREALEWAEETRAAMVDLKFCDLLGTWQHVTLPIRAFDESAFDEGLGFDGSSIRGWQAIQDSDMLLVPDASSAILDPRPRRRPSHSYVRSPIPSPASPTRETRVESPAGRRSTCARAGSPTRRTSARSASSSSSTRCTTTSGRTAPTTRSTPRRATGTPASRGSGTPLAPRRATSRRRPRTSSTTSAPRWCSPSSASASHVSSTTTKSLPAVSARSISASRR